MDLLNPASAHRAFYDNNGDIVLPGIAEPDGEMAPPEPVMEEVKTDPVAEEIIEWIVTDDVPAELPSVEASPVTKHTPSAPRVSEHIVALRQWTRQTVREGARQYRVSIEAGKPVIKDARHYAEGFLRALWAFLAQPVWVPTRRKQIKEYSRGTLFVLDIARFGTTFALIFLVLFGLLNYDSFWQITKSKVMSILKSPSIDIAENHDDDAIIETLKATANLSAGRDRGELLSFLPPVGPSENRILIPKLKLNIPLVQPPIDSLLRQDWTQVETDIQSALQHGVVHYPGTARPGQAGNFFVTGHSSYYPWAPGKYKTVFARLNELKPGDEYWVYYKGDRHRYIVESTREVSPSDITVLDQPANARLATLMTCTPVGTTLRRLIVLAQEVDPITGKPLAVGEKSQKPDTPKIQLEALPI